MENGLNEFKISTTYARFATGSPTILGPRMILDSE